VRAHNRRPRQARPRSLLAAVGVLAALLGTCAAGCTSGRSRPSPPPCSALAAEPPRGNSTLAQTVILVDRTRSARGTPGKVGTPNDYAAALEGTLRDAVLAGQTVLIAGFDGSTATITWTTVATAFHGDATAAVFARQGNLACLRDRLREAVTTAPVKEGSDVLGALQAAALQLGPNPPTGSRVVVATDGLANVGCADLDNAAIGDPGQIQAIVRDCRAANAIPDLRGVQMRLLGLGHPGPGRPIPESLHVTWLHQLWNRLCAESVQGRCEDVPVGDRGAAPSEVPPGAAQDPDVQFPSPVVHHIQNAIVFELPDSVLFATGSADLAASAHGVLDNVATEIRRLHGTGVRIEGHTDSRGGTGYNLELSRQRAKAVATALRRAGIAVAGITGFGETRPLAVPEYKPDGSPDLRAMARNRRVQVVATVPERRS
jgi:outer membrane protein OmpA-like peptidoglycan-associated protein